MPEHLRWSIFQRVAWPNTDPYEIVRLAGEVGNIHISGTGRYHVYWHRERPDGRLALVHHGGPQGFDSIQSVMDQHERVILGYTGVTIELPSEEAREFSLSGSTFPQLIAEMNTLVLPGEQRRIHKYIGTLLAATRDLPRATTNGEIAGIRQELKELKRDLGGSINRHKKAAAASLETGLIGTKGELLSRANDAQLHLLQRSRQTVSIVVGTMERYNALERLQLEWNEIVEGLPGVAGQVLKILESPSSDSEIEKVVRSNVLNKTLGLEGRLLRLQGEPYFGRAQQFIDSLSPLRKLWEERDYQKMLRILRTQALSLQIWKDKVRREYTGVNFGKYNLK